MAMFWYLILGIIAYLVYYWYTSPARIFKKRHLLAKKPNIIFDLHGVVVERKFFGICKHILKHTYRLDILLLCLKPTFTRNVFNLLKKSRVPEELAIKLSKKHPKLEPFVEVTIAMMNEQKIINSTFEVIKKLKQKGFKLYLFSNIGEKTFAQLEKKFPLLFSYFDGIVVAENHDDWIQKPSPAAFAKFLSRFDLKADECIFIDNSLRNITTAFDEGMYPILFQSPDQLLHELVTLHIL
jgi:HAD superfamily hydrolase (TIGR01509 family)